MNAIRPTVIALLLLAACSSDPGGPPPECDAPEDCTTPATCQLAAGASCAAGRCEYQTAVDGEACASGVCLGGACVECADSAGCDDGNPCTEDVCGSDHACSHPALVGEACDDADACTYADTCGAGATCAGTLVVCQGDVGVCGATRTCNGTSACTETYPGQEEPCDDGAACTFTDRCDGAGSCGGTALSCDGDPGPCGAERACNGTATCSVTFPSAATSCDDGQDCTHTDRCDGAGDCGGTALSCDGDPGPCGALRACNGTATCSVAYPDAATSCDDAQDCTHTDRCDGAGGCGGTIVVCQGDVGVCGATRTCNGTSACTETYPGQEEPCDDGAACTFTDRCDGAGSCGGTVIVCDGDPGPCGAERACNGTATCSVTFPSAATSCDDGQDCTHTDRCDGAGDCGGTAIACASDPGPCGLVRSCNGTATCTATYPGASVACDDGRGCSITDGCDGAGGCSGWPLMPNQEPLPMVDSDITGILGSALVLDASHAADPDAWCGDQVVNVDWDLDGDGVYDDAQGAVATLPWAQVAAYGFTVADPAASWQPAYDVSVRVTDQWGVRGIQPATLRICDPGPVAVATVTPSTAGCGVSMVFDGTGSYSREYSGRRIASYRWDFDVAVDSSGNGNPADDVDAVGSQVTYRHTRLGTRTARLTVTDDLGATASDDVDATLSFANRAPVAFTGGPYYTAPGGPLNLDGSGSSDPDQPCDGIAAWRWDTDNDDQYGPDDLNGSVLCGATDCVGSVLARVVDPGWLVGRSYALRLVVEDAYGQRSAPAETSITVAALPTPPAVVLVSPAGGEKLRGTASVTFKVSQPTGQQVTLEMRLNGVAIPFNGSATVSTGADGSQVAVTRTFNTASYANASDVYTLAVIAKLTALPAVTGQASSRSPFTIDNGAPAVSLPAGETAPALEVVALDGTPFTFHPTVTDSLDPAPLLVTNPVLSKYPLGTTPVIFTAVDWAGNVATRTVNVVVADTTPPSVALPEPGVLTAVTTDPAGARGLFWLPHPIASDLGTPAASLLASARVWMTLRDGSGAAVAPPANGYLLQDPQYAVLYFPPGDTAVRYRVTDSAGNFRETTLTVTVVVQ